MKHHFINYIKKVIYLIVFAGFSFANLANAGSYDDFFMAIKRDDPGTIKALLARGFDANTLDPQSQHGLYLAMREPSLKAAQVLIDWPKTDVNLLNAKGESPLMLAILKGQQDMAEKLIKKGADVNKTGWTPLHYAATSGQLAIISELLENHAYIDAESPNGTTPLMMAARQGNLEAVKLLVWEIADPTIKNEAGATALSLALKGNHSEIAKLLRVAGAKS